MLVSVVRGHIWPMLPLLVILVALATPVQGSERLQVAVDGKTVGDSISMPYSGPEGDPVSALQVEVSGVSGTVRFVIVPAGSDGCRGGEWEHASRDLMVAHDRQVNHYRAPASDWRPCSSARVGVIHDVSGQEVWWTVRFTDGSATTSSPGKALYEIDPGASDQSLAFVEKVLYNGEDITPEHTPLYEGSRIRTGPGVEIIIRYATGALVKVRQDSEMRIEPPTIIKDDISVMNSRLIKGILDFYGQSEKAKAEKKFEFETETAIVGIKGTQLTLVYEEGRTTLYVSEGEAEFTDKLTGRTITVRSGESASAGGQEESPGPQKGENLALNRPASQSSTAEEWGGNWSASRGVDGIKTGNIFDGGFHTEYEEGPWWQVDLGSVYDLSEARIYNRLDCCSDRAESLEVLLSRDGKNWWTVYTHDGSPFGGSDGNYLIVDLERESARFVRVALREANWLHLDEVEVFASPPGTASQEDDAEKSSTPTSDGPEICRGGLEGEWSSGSTRVTISSLDNGSYYLVATDGNFEHSGVMACERGLYHGYLSDTPGRCCGNDGEAWMKAIDDDTYAATSRWWPKGSARPDPIEQTSYDGWEMFRRVS
ncbi:MAG: hypothetical protein GYA39_00315 [Methanothrix sp.]|nr:hypothetical protein [Methanothrix sp.]